MYFYIPKISYIYFFSFFLGSKKTVLENNVRSLLYAESINKLRKDILDVIICDMDLNVIEISTKLRYLTRCLKNIKIIDLNEDQKDILKTFLWKSIPKNSLGSER